ncbi:MAG: NTP transferase domain-containing protein [Oligoflexia bacterium]|nr:NTP transferase domain-containing protein [Oligoflexia bacterium]
MYSHHENSEIFEGRRTSRREEWTAIIPAAGKGSRLNYHLPKILYPILDRPIIYWLIDLLSPYVKNFVFVLSPEGEDVVLKYLSEISLNSNIEVKIAIQEQPLGMGHAILMSESSVHTKHSLIIWGDQITVKPKTIERAISLHESSSTIFTLPSMMKENSYIHFERNQQGKIVYVYQKREENIPVAIGESDCGLFLVDSKTLFSTLNFAFDIKQRSKYSGATTKEFNFLQLIPEFAQVQTLNMDDESETLGINTKEDAKLVEEILSNRYK